MTFLCSYQLIFVSLVIICSTNESNASRHRRQVVDVSNPNARVPQQKTDGSVPSNAIPFNPSNIPNKGIPNERNNPERLGNINPSIIVSQPQIEPVRSQGFYSNPSFQPSPFTGQKPSGWFGTNHVNWVSNQDSESDKNKIAAMKNAHLNPSQGNVVQPQREDGGPIFLEKVAKAYASKGVKAFDGDQYETRQGHGTVCSNHDYFDGFVFGTFSCPLPPSTGMNQLDQFCCGPANYQYCCNAQEFSQNQRGAFGDHRFGKTGFPTRTSYSSSTKRILAIISPIAGFIVLAGIIALVVIHYRNLQKEQNRIGKPSGASRLSDSYSVLPQEPTVENVILTT